MPPGGGRAEEERTGRESSLGGEKELEERLSRWGWGTGARMCRALCAMVRSAGLSPCRKRKNRLSAKHEAPLVRVFWPALSHTPGMSVDTNQVASNALPSRHCLLVSGPTG